MNKNNLPAPKVLRINAALFFIVCMLAGFFLSRAMLSIAMMLLGFAGLLGIHPKYWLKERWWILGLSWILLYLISFFWSHDPAYWYTRNQIKLPILLLPLAFAFIPAFNARHHVIYTLALNTLLYCGAAYSLFFLLRDPDFYIKGYDYSHVLPTIPKNDHIVFSLAMAAGVVWNVYLFPHIRERWVKGFSIFAIAGFIIMLHVLAARTGLVALYIFLLGWMVYLALRKRTRLAGLSLITFFVFAALLAVQYIPTLRNRVNHTKYTLLMFKEGNMSGDYSDIGRYMSYDIALKLIGEHPLKGVGAGNILHAMKEGYEKWYPHVPDEQRLIPHNQFLTVGVACGIPALLLFIAWVFYPLLEIKRTRAGFFFFILWAMMLLYLMVEPALEIQFGVFVYLFFLLWQRHAMLKDVYSSTQRHDSL